MNPRKNIWINKSNLGAFNKERNKSGLVNELLSRHYAEYTENNVKALEVFKKADRLLTGTENNVRPKDTGYVGTRSANFGPRKPLPKTKTRT